MPSCACWKTRFFSPDANIRATWIRLWPCVTVGKPPPDQSFHKYRTIAFLRHSDREAAAAEYAKALDAFKAGRSWADPRPLAPLLQPGHSVTELRGDPVLKYEDWGIELNCLPPEQ